MKRNDYVAESLAGWVFFLLGIITQSHSLIVALVFFLVATVFHSLSLYHIFRGRS